MAAATSAATSDTGTRCAGGEGREGAWRGSDAKEDARWSPSKKVAGFRYAFVEAKRVQARRDVRVVRRHRGVASSVHRGDETGGWRDGGFPKRGERLRVAGWVESRRRRGRGRGRGWGASSTEVVERDGFVLHRLLWERVRSATCPLHPRVTARVCALALERLARVEDLPLPLARIPARRSPGPGPTRGRHGNTVPSCVPGGGSRER